MIGDNKSLISLGFLAQLLPKIIKCYISRSAPKVVFFLQHGKEQQMGKNHLIEVLRNLYKLLY